MYDTRIKHARLSMRCRAADVLSGKAALHSEGILLPHSISL